MHEEIIRNVEEKPALSLADKLKDQFKETFDLIIHHEWMIDLLNSKLSLNQFESFIVQEAYIYDLLAKQVLNFAINKAEEDYDELMRVGVFLYSDSYESLRPLEDDYSLFCSTRSYCENLENIWNGSSYPHKLLTILVQLWIREEIYHIFASEKTYFHNFTIWTEKISNNSPQELVSYLSRILNQSFIKNYGHDQETQIYHEGFKELEFLLSTFIQSELAVRNQAYQINFDQFQQNKQS